jgi:hypothetical protein
MFNQGITLMKDLEITKTTFGITMQTSWTKEILVQPTTTTNQRGCILGFLTTTTLI